MFRARLLNDGSILHFQFSPDGFFWVEYFSLATPASLAYYGFMTGNGAGSGSTGAISMLILRNKYSGSGSLNVPQVNVSAATNGTPNTVTTSTPHGLYTGDHVCIHGMVGQTNLNGVAGNNLSAVWPVIVTSPTQFTAIGSSGGGTYTSGGVVTCTSR